MRYIIQTGNAAAGGDTNLADTVLHVVDTLPATPDQVTAQLIAFAQYWSCATDTYVAGIERGADAPGPTLPQTFPTAEYATLQAADTNILPMTAFGDLYGTGALAPLGVGQVLSKRSTTPGRTGRGRMTTPWLRTAAVASNGIGVVANLQFLVDGWFEYLMGDNTGTGMGVGIDLAPYIYPSASPIVNVTATTRLGRVRSRAA
jgi:hypothetical protein